MEELLELRQLIEAGHLPEAMLLLDEMDEMAKDDKINKIESYLEILLLHLIKQQVEQRTTGSWDASSRNATRHVLRSWKRRTAGGYYLTEDELSEAITEAFPSALDAAAQEAVNGKLSVKQLTEKVNRVQIQAEALRQILNFNDQASLSDSDSDLPQWLK